MFFSLALQLTQAPSVIEKLISAHYPSQYVAHALNLKHSHVLGACHVSVHYCGHRGWVRFCHKFGVNAEVQRLRQGQQISIDGRLEEEAWAEAHHHPNLFRKPR